MLSAALSATYALLLTVASPQAGAAVGLRGHEGKEIQRPPPARGATVKEER